MLKLVGRVCDVSLVRNKMQNTLPTTSLYRQHKANSLTSVVLKSTGGADWEGGRTFLKKELSNHLHGDCIFNNCATFVRSFVSYNSVSHIHLTLNT